jgi:hypothetical protein
MILATALNRGVGEPRTLPTSSAPKYLTDRVEPGTIKGLDYDFNNGTLWLHSESGQALRVDADNGVISIRVFNGPLNITTNHR